MVIGVDVHEILNILSYICNVKFKILILKFEGANML